MGLLESQWEYFSYTNHAPRRAVFANVQGARRHAHELYRYALRRSRCSTWASVGCDCCSRTPHTRIAETEARGVVASLRRGAAFRGVRRGRVGQPDRPAIRPSGTKRYLKRALRCGVQMLSSCGDWVLGSWELSLNVHSSSPEFR